MGEMVMVILDVQPVPPSFEWLVWVLRPKGDMDRNQHRSTFEVASLKKVDLVSKVEELIGLSLFPLSD
jgi:hypothetical protein